MKASIPASGSDSRHPEHRPIGGQDLRQISEKMLDKTIVHDELNKAVDETSLCQRRNTLNRSNEVALLRVRNCLEPIVRAQLPVDVMEMIA